MVVVVVVSTLYSLRTLYFITIVPEKHPVEGVYVSKFGLKLVNFRVF